jgi:hypothetical protein
MTCSILCIMGCYLISNIFYQDHLDISSLWNDLFNTLELLDPYILVYFKGFWSRFSLGNITLSNEFFKNIVYYIDFL